MKLLAPAGYVSMLMITAAASTAALAAASDEPLATQAAKDFCGDLFDDASLRSLAGSSEICERLRHLAPCVSEEQRPIPHYERPAARDEGRRILVFSMIHGDEPESGVAAAHWISRLDSLDPRNSWRIVPILNPDGRVLKTRGNSRSVDLNRNFPTADWQETAEKHWTERGRKDPRRFPGTGPGSEAETRCAVAHIESFAPDFVVALHTPYGLLDFDGPKDLPRAKSMLPWVSLGHFPGSLGRYMWHDRSVPVLTVEFKPGKASKSWIADLVAMQDMIGQMAMGTPKATTVAVERPPEGAKR